MRSDEFDPILPTDTGVWVLFVNTRPSAFIIESVNVANGTASAATCRIGFDQSGADDLAQRMAIAWDMSVPANESIDRDRMRYRLKTGGRVLVRSGTASALAFSLGGQWE